MFNLARHRNNNVPDRLQDEGVLFQARINNPQSLMEDAQHLAFTMVRHGLHSAEEGLNEQGNVEFWEYVKKFHPKYLDKVFELAEQLAKKLSHDFFNHPEKFPIPAGGQGGGGGGMGGPGGGGPPPPGGDPGGAPPPMASSNKRTVIAQDEEGVGGQSGYYYLYKPDSTNYSFFSTWAGKIMSGRIDGIDADGRIYNYYITQNERHNRADRPAVRVPRSSPVVDQVFRMEQELPSALAQAVVAAVKVHGKDYDPRAASAMIDNAFKNASWDLAPIESMFTGDIEALLLEMDQGFYTEHKATESVRMAIGLVMQPWIQAMEKALLMHGYTVKRQGPNNKRSSRVGAEDHEKVKAELDVREFSTEPHLLVNDSIMRGSFDVPSLIMTAVSQQLDRPVRLSAVARLADLIAWSYNVYKRRPISDAELSRMMDLEGYAPDPNAVRNLMIVRNASLADDAGFMEAYVGAFSLDMKEKLANLAATQKRENLIRAMPKMAVPWSRIVPKAWEMLDPTDPKALNVIKEAKDNGSDVSEKVMEAIYKTGDKEMINKSISSGTPNSADFLATLYAIEKGLPEARYAVNALKRTPWEGISSAAGKIICTKSNDPELIKGLMQRSPQDCSPSVLRMFGEDIAKNIMKTMRLDWSGKPIPSASEIYSVPKKPLELAKSLVTIEDFQALNALFYTVAQEMSRGAQNEETHYALNYMFSALSQAGMGEQAQQVLSQFRMFRNDTGQYKNIANPGQFAASDITIEHVQDALDGGDILTSARLLNKIYQANPGGAYEVMSLLRPPANPDAFLAMLPHDMTSQAAMMPQWAHRKQQDVEASILPNGAVLVRLGSVYKVKADGVEHVFAATAAEAPRIAMEKIIKGKTGAGQ